VKKGKSFVVLSHGEPVARIIPIGEDKEAAKRSMEAFLRRLAARPVTDIGKWTRDELYEETL
jgi:antitoxin (DNA-binding transcriptional repressor) of toxin-antitoxin stability system